MKVTPVSINPREPAELVINHPKIAGRLALAGLPNPGARQRDLAIPPEGNMEVILGRRLMRLSKINLYGFLLNCTGYHADLLYLIFAQTLNDVNGNNFTGGVLYTGGKLWAKQHRKPLLTNLLTARPPSLNHHPQPLLQKVGQLLAA